MVRRSTFIVVGMCAAIISATIAPQPVEARGFFRHLAERMAVRGAEAGAVGYGISELGAAATLAEATESMELSAGGMSQAVADIRAFLLRHRLAGNSEMAHAMKKAVEDHPDRLQVMQNLASQSGVRVDLTKVKKKLEPPGRCSWKRYDELKNAKERACDGEDDEGSPIRSCKPDIPGKSNEAKIDIWKRYIDIAKACRQARKNMMKECFDDGDDGHQTAVKQLNSIIRRCNEKVGYKNEPEDYEYEKANKK